MTIPAPPPPTATNKQWHDWIEHWFPFDPEKERYLQRRARLKAEVPEVGSRDEIDDLRGVADAVTFGSIESRTRWVAVELAKLWFSMRERELRERARQTRMPTRELQHARDDFDNAIAANSYTQQGFGYGQ